MTLDEAKHNLKTNGFCEFELKDFSEESYNTILEKKYCINDEEYLKNFKLIRFDYHNGDSDVHIQSHDMCESNLIAKEKIKEILNKYDKEYIAQVWLEGPNNLNQETNPDIFYKILSYFYPGKEKDVNFGLQWTCYSEGCFLKNHNDGQGEEYQNTCAILIYLNEEWDESWGGNLILRTETSAFSTETGYKIVPKFGKVAIIDLETFDKAHAVEDVIGDHNRFAFIGFATSKTKREKKYI
jgi:hypothetical protein